MCPQQLLKDYTSSLKTHAGRVDHKVAVRKATRKLNDHQELYVIGMILHEPALYLGVSELYQQVHDIFDLEVSPATICVLLKRYGVSRKKITQVAKQRRDSLTQPKTSHNAQPKTSHNVQHA